MIRKIDEKKYLVEIYRITWHAACETVWRSGEKNSICYSDLDGEHVYIWQIVKYLSAGWDILTWLERDKIVLTGDNYPVNDVRSCTWTPSSENINTLPEPIRQFIHDLETQCDPAGMVAENTFLRDQIKQMQKKIEESR
jgi:hypothetical protein